MQRPGDNSSGLFLSSAYILQEKYMPDIYTILAQEDFSQVVNDLCVDTKEGRNPIEYKEEYDGERRRRKTSVGWREPKHLEVYSDNLTDKNGNPLRLDDKTVDVARIVTNFPRKLVRTDTAMMFGGRMAISADKQDDGFNEFKRVWERVLGMQDILIEFAEKVLSETKAALIFYPTIFQHWSGRVASEVNCKILSLPDNPNLLSEFYPHFHNGSMDGFIHRYQIVDETTMVREQVKIWTREKIVTATQSWTGWEEKVIPNIWGLLPVVYAEIDEPDWDEVSVVMDAREMRLSRLADTNDYFAEPTIVSYGETSLPGKNTVGKEIQYPIVYDDETGKPVHGDAKVLAWDQSINSVEKELDVLGNEQFAGASAVDTSLNNLKGLGNLSGVSRRFMMLDTEIKQKINMRIFRPVLNRCITVVSAGIANVTNIKYKQQLANNWISVTFESIIPKDPVEEAQILSIAGGGKPFNSKETLVSKSPLTPPGDIEGELARMAADDENEAKRNSLIGMTGY